MAAGGRQNMSRSMFILTLTLHMSIGNCLGPDGSPEAAAGAPGNARGRSWHHSLSVSSRRHSFLHPPPSIHPSLSPLFSEPPTLRSTLFLLSPLRAPIPQGSCRQLLAGCLAAPQFFFSFSNHNCCDPLIKKKPAMGDPLARAHSEVPHRGPKSMKTSA